MTQLVESGKLVQWFEARYPKNHEIKSEKALFDYAISGEHILLEGVDWQDASSLQQIVEGSPDVPTM